MSSGGGGKGGGKKTTTETTVPEWVRAPADRNLQRAEALQQIEYMPYYGAQVAAFNDNQAAAFQNNNDAASAFGLLAPTDAMSSMPTPTTYANGMKGYSSIPLYDQAMKELTASNPDNMDAYSKLFGNAVPANVAPQPQYAGRGGGGGGGGGQPQAQKTLLPSDINAAKWGADRTVTGGGRGGRGNVGAKQGSGILAGSQNRNYVQNRAVQSVNQINKKAGKKVATRTGGKYGFGI